MRAPYAVTRSVRHISQTTRCSLVAGTLETISLVAFCITIQPRNNVYTVWLMNNRILVSNQGLWFDSLRHKGCLILFTISVVQTGCGVYVVVTRVRF
jgi:hypothetical protein